MKKWMKWTLGVIVVLALALFGLFKYFQAETKSHSPEDTIAFIGNDMDIMVDYCRPYKKEREIFGALVPYGETWRTGANEATTFDTKTDLLIGGEVLPAGHYTLWTVPGPESWEIIWNSKDYPWGLGWGGKASREPEFDVLKISVPTETMDDIIEQFTIAINAQGMSLAWDRTKVFVPMEGA
ncbi:MAG: DUF2911 domain-containing protein [Bacteroidota bacterium]|nr:DUF2911 domain-containing protein [Bacteroidota bacterium]MDX5428281.1 DUF2911 domain-containing protein [Bacteroidota bacterium]